MFQIAFGLGSDTWKAAWYSDIPRTLVSLPDLIIAKKKKNSNLILLFLALIPTFKPACCICSFSIFIRFNAGANNCHK